MNTFKSDMIGNILFATRNKSNKTQKFMAKALNKSVGTIQNWEFGLATPNLIDTFEWFNVLGINPLPYFLNYFYPDYYTKYSDVNVTTQLVNYIQNIASESEKKKLAYCIWGKTGSSWQHQIDMLVAHNHTSMKSRVNTAQVIMDNYDMEKYRGELINTDDIMCDEDMLRSAIELGKKAAYQNSNTYFK